VHLDASFGITRREPLEELSEHARPEADQTDHCIFDAGSRQTAIFRKCGDSLGLIIQDETEQVGIVNREVEDRSGPCRGILQSPPVQMLRQIASVGDSSGERAADAATPDHVSHRPRDRTVAEMTIGRHDHTGALASDDHFLRFGQALSERLLAKDVSGGGDGLCSMALIGRRDVDRVDAGCEQIGQAGDRLRYPELVGISAATRPVGAHHCDHIATRLADRRDHPFPTNDSGAD
jgi:hypothetical protein